MSHGINFRRVVPVIGKARKPLTLEQKKAQRHSKRTKRLAARAAAVALRIKKHNVQIARERFGLETLKRNPKGVRASETTKGVCKVAGRERPRETNRRYPFTEIVAARDEGRKLEPQTKAVHW